MCRLRELLCHSEHTDDSLVRRDKQTRTNMFVGLASLLWFSQKCELIHRPVGAVVSTVASHKKDLGSHHSWGRAFSCLDVLPIYEWVSGGTLRFLTIKNMHIRSDLSQCLLPRHSLRIWTCWRGAVGCSPKRREPGSLHCTMYVIIKDSSSEKHQLSDVSSTSDSTFSGCLGSFSVHL